jgi:hypothetical protein
MTISPGTQFKRNALSVAGWCCLAVLLGIQLQRMIATKVYKASVPRMLNTAAAIHQGANLADVRFQRDSGRTLDPSDIVICKNTRWIH